MKSNTFFPRLAAYFVALPVLLVIYLSSHGIMPTQMMLPLLAVTLIAAIWGRARIRRSYPQNFGRREEWVAFGIFLLLVVAGVLFVVK